MYKRQRSTVRAAPREERFDVKEVLYLGFEGRPPATSYDAFLENVEMQVDIYRMSHNRPLVYATGFGALILLALRARGNVRDLPAVIQGPIPWSWAKDRADGAHAEGEAARLSFADPAFQESFIVDHIHSPFDAAERKAFFGGFTTCTAFPQVYGWLNKGWAAALEGLLAARPAAIDDIRVWECGEDTLADAEDHDAAVRALGAQWSTERAERWGHFPYLDSPGPWIGALQAMGV